MKNIISKSIFPRDYHRSGDFRSIVTGTLDHLFVVCSPLRTALQHFQVCFLNSFGKFLENWLSFDFFF